MYKVEYTEGLRAANTDAGPSPSIWADCPILDIIVDPRQGYGIFDDFLTYSSTATTVLNASGLPTFEGDCTIGGTAIAGGEVALFCTTSNEEAALEACGAQSAPFVIPASTTATSNKLWFECRVKKSTIADSIANFFVGLASQGSGVADFIHNDGNDFADVDLLGFVQWEADGDAINVVTQKTGAAFDTIISGVDTAVADTYAKLGFKYDPTAVVGERIKFYVDGAEQTTYVGEASGDATVYIQDTTNFPGGEEMTPVIAVKGGSASDYTVTMDWWRCYQGRSS